MKSTLNSCCGIDVHKKNIVACVMYPQGSAVKKKIVTFETDTQSLLRFSQWLSEFNLTDIVLESTGPYWVPVFNILEREGFNVILANARNVKNVPGRKTDVRDCEWLCKLLKNGLIEKSFIPPEKIRSIRTLTRHRDSLIKDRTRYKNRILKILEYGNIKLSSVLTDCFGVTGWKLIQKLAQGRLNIQKAILGLPKTIKATSKQLEAALQGTLNQTHREVLKGLIRQIKSINKEINLIEELILESTKELESEVTLLTTIPGIDKTAACRIIGEIGVDMTFFPTAGHLTSWGCVCPGNHESAGKKYSTSIRKGCNYLKSLLVQISWAVAKTKTYLGAKYRKIASRKGKKKALIVIARKLLIICYHILDKLEPYNELGVDFLESLKPNDKTKYYLNQLRKLGHDVFIEPKREATKA